MAYNTNTVLLLHFDGADESTTFTDSSESGKTVTANGDAQIDTAQSKFGGASGLFDGTGDYLTLDDSADWDFGTGDFTVDFWVRFNSVTTGSNQAFISRDGSNFEIGFGSENNFYIRTANEAVLTTAWTPLVNTFYHIAVTRASGSLRGFVDGTQIGTTVTDDNDIQASTELYIGSEGASSYFLNGWIDELRILKGEAAWTSNFTAPTLAYTSYGVGKDFFTVIGLLM